MSVGELDPVIHAPKRLAIMSVLAHCTSVDFAFLRELLSITDSDLSKQMSMLERIGYVSVTKSRGRGGGTSYCITPHGADAFRNHVAALRAIVGQTAYEHSVPS